MRCIPLSKRTEQQIYGHRILTNAGVKTVRMLLNTAKTFFEEENLAYEIMVAHLHLCGDDKLQVMLVHKDEETRTHILAFYIHMQNTFIKVREQEKKLTIAMLESYLRGNNGRRSNHILSGRHGGRNKTVSRAL